MKHEILWDFQIQIDHPIPARRPDQVLINKKKENLLSSGFCHSSRPQSKKKRKWKDTQIPGSYLRTKKTIEHADNGDIHCSRCTRNGPQSLGKRIRRVRNQRKNPGHSNYGIIEISQNTEKSPGYMRRLSGNQTSEEPQLLLLLKTHKKILKIIIIIINKARIDKTQQNSKCRLCGDRDETINHIISKCSKLAQREYKARHDWVGKVIHWEMCKKFKFDHTNKWYMHKPAPVLENATHKLLWYFDIQTDHQIPARRPDLIIINKKKKTCKIVDFAVPADHRIKLKECEKKDKYLDLARQLKKLWNMQVIIIPI